MTIGTRFGVVMLLCMACHTLAQAQLPQLKINDKEDPNVYLSHLCVDVKVIGTIAITTMEMTFRNKNSRILEGELVFPLPEGISVSRYALDINGQMREAVPVEKEKATQVFEEIEHQRVDPGLLERVEGNNFRTRIYPLPANGSRTIIIAFEEELAFTSKQSLRYHLPLDHKKPIDHFKLNISVLQSALQPQLEEEPDGDLQFKEWNHNYTAAIDKKDFTPEHSLTINIPKSPDNAEAMMQQAGGNYYFLVNCFPQKDSRPKAKVNEVTVLWDASLSGLNRNIQKELELLGGYIAHNGNLVVHLAFLNNTFRKAGSFTIRQGNWQELKKAIEQLNYDGGTNYSQINFAGSDEYLFFTDGLSSLSTSEEIKLPNKPVYTISSAPRSDFAYLQYIAQKTGGTFINLDALKPAEAEKLLTQQSLQFLGIKNNPLVSETYPSLPRPVINNLSVAGIVTEPSATIILQFGYGNTVTTEKTIRLDYSKQGSGNINLARVWAQKKLGELDVRYEQNKEMITFLGKRFSIVTRNTSLIVLETVNDYVRYEIEPPAELRQQYDRLIKQQLAQRQNRVKVTLANAQEQLNALVNWWNLNFIAKPTPRPGKKNQLTNTHSRVVTDEGIVSPPPAIERLEDVRISQQNMVGSADKAAAPQYQYNQAFKEVAPGTTAGHYSPQRSTAQFTAPRIVKDEEVKADDDHRRHEPTTTSSISIKQWTPDRSYLQALAKEKAGNRYKAYLALRKDYLYTPTFYYDVANFFFREQDTLTGLQILTNMAEIDLENHELYKLLGYKLREAGAYKEAITIFRKVLQWRPQEPHSYRDYGLALADAGRYQQALDTLYTALQKNYSESIAGMYNGMEEIIVTEINQLISLHKHQLNLSGIDRKLIHALPTDIRVVLNWNKSDTDMDLWVTDPNDETCYYSHKETLIGGRISNDFTQGYGPEQFLLKKAINGKYQVKVNYYGDQQVKLSGPTTVLAEIFTHYADGRQERKLITLQMEKGDEKEGILVGEFAFGPKAWDNEQAVYKK
jgi:tetratricopeptide (TPR) repeat protein